MKTRNREINIFSMSALDLFASALGAFILLAVVALPYFGNTGNSPENVAKIKKELKQAKSKLAACQKKSKKQQSDLNKCSAQLKKKFLLVLMSWKTKGDVDLHVVDPNGNEFYYKKRSFPGTSAKFEEDGTKGPGNEIWLHPAATPGKYKVYYKYFSKRQKQASIRGAMVTPDGRTEFRRVTLKRKKEKVLAATIIVDASGVARLQ